MRKRSRKLLSILLTLSLLVALLVPIGAASAATTNIVTTTPTFTQNAGNVSLGQIWVYENDDQAGSVFMDGESLNITVTLLTSGVEFQNAPDNTNKADYVAPLSTLAATNKIVPADIDVIGGTLKTYTITVEPSLTAGTRSGLQFMFPVNISGATSGPIEVEISAPDTGITSGRFVVGYIAGTGTRAVLLDDSTVQVGVTNAACGLFRIEEAVIDSLQNGDNIRIDLPADMEWNSATTVTAVGVSIGPRTITTSPSGYSRLTIPVTGNPAGGSRAMITVAPRINVDDDAMEGDITISISGTTSNVTSATLVIGKVATYGVTVKASGDPKNIIAGSIDQEIGNFIISEGVAGSLLSGRTVLIELPSYVKWWSSEPTVTRESGDGTLTSTPGATSDDNRNIKKYTVGGSNSATSFKFERMRVFVDADAPAGDVKVKFSGTGGLSGELVLAKVVKPVSATGGADRVIIGSANQKVADVVITEGLRGAAWGNPTIVTNATKTAVTTSTNNQGWIKIEAPNGVTFANKPTVEVLEGNIRLNKDTIQLQDNDKVLAVRVTNGSTVASKVKVSNINLTVDRTVPEGALQLGITGTALDRVTFDNTGALNNTYVERVTVATVTTPAPADEKKTAVFTIGESKFTLNGVDVTMDVAPYLKNDRTYLPIRFVAQAVGVSDSNIMWNAADNSVVMIKGDRVVKLVIGSTTMMVNGVAITMDVAPEIVAPGRTMLPLRWAAQALGANVAWDAATQTVTIN